MVHHDDPDEVGIPHRVARPLTSRSAISGPRDPITSSSRRVLEKEGCTLSSFEYRITLVI